MNNSSKTPGKWCPNDAGAPPSTPSRAAAPPAVLQSFAYAPHNDSGFEIDTLLPGAVQARAPSEDEFKAMTCELRSFAAMGEGEMIDFVRSLSKRDLMSTSLLERVTAELDRARAYIDEQKAYNERVQKNLSVTKEIVLRSHETTTRLEDDLTQLERPVGTLRQKQRSLNDMATDSTVPMSAHLTTVSSVSSPTSSTQPTPQPPYYQEARIVPIDELDMKKANTVQVRASLFGQTGIDTRRDLDEWMVRDGLVTSDVDLWLSDLQNNDFHLHREFNSNQDAFRAVYEDEIPAHNYTKIVKSGGKKRDKIRRLCAYLGLV